jgi:hypothetical protein
MAFVKAKQYALFLLFIFVLSSYAFVHQPSKNGIRPELLDIVDQQDNTQLKIELHVGDESSGYLTVKDMIVQFGGRYDENEDEHMKLPGKSDRNAKYTSGGRRLNIVSKGNYINMKGLQHIDCNMGCWEMCWAKGSPAGMIIVAFNLPQTYSRNNAILPGGDMWLSFPVWTREGLKIGQIAKREVLDEIEMYDQKWNEELDKYEMTSNPIMRAIHERNAHIYATKCDDLYDYSLDTIPEDDQCSKLQEDLFISKRGLIWKKDGKDDVLLGHAVASPVHGRASLSSYSSGTLRP